MQERYTKQAENVLVLAKQAASSADIVILARSSAGRSCGRKRGNCWKSAGRFGIQADKTLALIE